MINKVILQVLSHWLLWIKKKNLLTPACRHFSLYFSYENVEIQKDHKWQVVAQQKLKPDSCL